MKWFLKRIVKFLIKWCVSRNKVFTITGGPNDDTPYLVRYIVAKSKFGCIYIHRFMRSDADDPHDHPWNFLTYIVEGSYTEVYFDKRYPHGNPITNEFTTFWTAFKNVRKEGSLAYRKATDIHKVVVDKPRDLDQIESAPLTICFMGPRIRDWGFWLEKLQGSGFLDWRSYLNITLDDERIEGSE